MAARPTGRLVPWTERDRAEWIAHELDGFILLEPVSERAQREMARHPDCICEDEWLVADWWDSSFVEDAVAREIANGWNVTTPPSDPPFDSEQFARMLAAILTGYEAVSPDDVTDEAAHEALQIAGCS